MKHIERTFLESASRFFEPFIKGKVIVIQTLIHHFSFSIVSVFVALFVQYTVKILEKGVQDDLNQFLITSAVVFFAYQIYILFIKHLGWCKFEPMLQQIIYKIYLPRFIQMDNTEYEKVGTGKAIAIISKGAKTYTILGESVIMTGVETLIGLVFVFAMISQVSYTLGVIFLVLLIFGLGLGGYLNKTVLKYRRKRNDYDNLCIARIVKIIMSKYEILQSNKINLELEKLGFSQEKKAYYNKKLSLTLILFFLIPDWIVFTMLFLSFLYFGDLYFTGQIELSLLIGISGALIIMQKVFADTMRLLKDFTKNFAEIEKMWDFFDSTPDIKGYEEGADFQYKTGKIELQNMSFGYGENKKVFDNFSLKIEGEKITALVGNSGSGKSTLVKLISGYIRQDQGKILVDDQNLENTSLKSYYKSIGYLTQEPSVFDGTIRENLMYGIDENNVGTADLQSLLGEVILLAKCEFIYELENGLDTEIGEKGVRLSGGQRQRIAIAKIMLSDPEIIILDEPTSALDSFSEEQITKALNNLFKNRTVLVIAHRLQTVKHADRILVLENGVVVEEGNHKKLVEQKGIYKKMLDLQSGF